MDKPPKAVEEVQFDRRKLPALIVGIVGGCGLVCVLLFIGMYKLAILPFPPSVTPTLTASNTPQPTTTSALSLNPSATPTHTPRPTQTATPIPAWVTSFAEPILAAIANTSPHFEDDFSQESDGWRFAKENGDRCWIEIKDGTLIMTVETGREVAFCSHPGMRFNNFVLRVDVDLHKLGPDTAAEIDWRGTGYSTGLVLSLWKDGRWLINFCGTDCSEVASGWQSISPTQKVTVTIISKIREYAIYLDETPVSYINDSGRRPGLEIKLSLWADSRSPKTIVAYDNLKIWNLDYIDSTSATVPSSTDIPSLTSPTTPDQRVLNPANQHLYLYVKIPLAWHEARDYCATRGGHLVTIQTPSENRFVYELATENVQMGTWLGATDEAQEGIWVWVTGEPANYWNWGEYWNYSGKDGTEDFLAFDGWDKIWYDQPDGDKYFVCEWEP